MEISLNEIIDYYAKADVSFVGAFGERISPELKVLNRHTNPAGGGLVIPFSGSACFTFDGKPYVIEPGMVVHAGPGMRLSKEVIGDREWEYAVIHYHIPQQERDKYPLFHKDFSLAHGRSAKVPHLVRQILDNQSIPGAAAKFQTKVLFLSLLQEIFTAACGQPGHGDSKLIEEAMGYIRLNYADELTVQKVADEFSIERRQFSYLFKRHTGMSPIHYLIECRISKAKELLGSPGCSVKQVAGWVGYPDSLYFSKAFKKYTGVSPSEYQQKSMGF
ncbi:Transcriptional regulator, AraC [Desulfitobacterium hafniense]|uniref:Transcriptional regulator, AraC n=1 Tax=Desulfitobacterium hafniense TaxID=49338 RepID=A0A098B6E4_DESHA|nr:AraC family transcriptional regulator [Desulfitobacterium hafniense]CDX03940.1 Transcriptional regulator, AraC [Desulfitobacterium hafniense]